LKSIDTYFIQEINAWKYEKESLRRVFLKQLWQGVSGEKLKSFHEIQQAFSDLINNAIKPTNAILKTKLWCTLFKYILTVLVIILITLVGPYDTL